MRGYLWANVVFCSVLSAGLPASGALYTVPLDGLRGVYSTVLGPTPDGIEWPPHTRTASFDLGFGFERVDAVRVHATGTIAPALLRDSLGTDSELAPSIILFSMWSQELPVGYGPLFANPEGGTFDKEASLRNELTFSEDWSENAMFLTGRGEMAAQITAFDLIGNEGGAVGQVVPGVVAIADAYLIIDGVAIPEPSSIWLAGAACAAFLSRRARRQAEKAS